MWFDPRKALAATPSQKTGTDPGPDANRAIRANPSGPISMISMISTPPAADVRNPLWSEATRRAVEYRRTLTPPTCARCGVTDWLVSITEPDGRKLHVTCWQAETLESKD